MMRQMGSNTSGTSVTLLSSSTTDQRSGVAVDARVRVPASFVCVFSLVIEPVRALLELPDPRPAEPPAGKYCKLSPLCAKGRSMLGSRLMSLHRAIITYAFIFVLIGTIAGPPPPPSLLGGGAASEPLRSSAAFLIQVDVPLQASLFLLGRCIQRRAHIYATQLRAR